MRRNTTADFWAHVTVGGDGECWPWTGQIQNGYGVFRLGPTKRKAHRIAYELCVGSIPEGLDLDHLCLRRDCVNPRHLEPVTKMVNSERGSLTYGARRTQCRHGHAFTEANTRYDRAGKRRCIECCRRRGREYAQRVRESCR